MKSHIKGCCLTLAAATAVIAAGATPSRAAVGVREGIVVDTVPVIRTTQDEVHVVELPGQPTRRAGSLPRKASPMMPDGRVAWSVTTGRRPARKVRLYQIDPRTAEVEEMALHPAKELGTVNVAGVAGADPLFVFLSPSIRYRRGTGALEPGHLDGFPDLRILQTLNRGSETWYLAVGEALRSGQAPPLRLLHSRNGGLPWISVPAGTLDGAASIARSGEDLFLVHRNGPVLRFDVTTLRLEEDLSPMMRSGKIEYFSADAFSYWIVTEPRDGGDRSDLWKVERQTLDGGLFHAGALPAGFVPVADDGARIWFGSDDQPSSQPLIAADKHDTTAQAYSITGKHERRWRSFGRIVGVTVVAAVLVPVFAAVLVVGAPLWIPVIVASAM